MPSRISIQLNDITRDLLEAEAGQRKISLSGLLREIAAEAAKEFRRQRIRRQTQAVAEYIAVNPEAKEFYEFWGTPTAELPEWTQPLPAAWLKKTEPK